jgi:hypothetical protein
MPVGKECDSVRIAGECQLAKNVIVALRNSTVGFKLLQINGFVYSSSYIFISEK